MSIIKYGDDTPIKSFYADEDLDHKILCVKCGKEKIVVAFDIDVETEVICECEIEQDQSS